MWKLLVVDDDFANRQLIIDMLEGRAQCDVAVNGKEAVEAYNISVETQNRYQLILLDIAMPEMDGLQFLEIVREHEKKAGIQIGQGIPIIMVTAYKQPFLEAFNLGCDDYILKPVNPDELITKITKKLDKEKCSDEKCAQNETGQNVAFATDGSEDVLEENSKQLKIPYEYR